MFKEFTMQINWLDKLDRLQAQLETQYIKAGQTFKTSLYLA